MPKTCQWLHISFKIQTLPLPTRPCIIRPLSLLIPFLTFSPLFLHSNHAIHLFASQTHKVCYCLRGVFSSFYQEYSSNKNYSSWIILFTSAERHSLSILYYSHCPPHISNPKSPSPCLTYFTSQHLLVSELYDLFVYSFIVYLPH